MLARDVVHLISRARIRDAAKAAAKNQTSASIGAGPVPVKNEAQLLLIIAEKLRGTRLIVC